MTGTDLQLDNRCSMTNALGEEVHKRSNCGEIVRGQYQFTIMPFVFYVGPMTSQRIMEHSTGYVDNVIIFNLDWESHRGYSDKVITELQRADFTIN